MQRLKKLHIETETQVSVVPCWSKLFPYSCRPLQDSLAACCYGRLLQTSPDVAQLLPVFHHCNTHTHTQMKGRFKCHVCPHMGDKTNENKGMGGCTIVKQRKTRVE